MYKISAAILILGGAICFGPTVPTAASAAPYYACEENGVEFQLAPNKDAARCLQTFPTEYANAADEPHCKGPFKIAEEEFPTHYGIDHDGEEDRCVTKMTIGGIDTGVVGGVECPPEYDKLKVSAGKDQCYNKKPPKSIAPTVPVDK